MEWVVQQPPRSSETRPLPSLCQTQAHLWGLPRAHQRAARRHGGHRLGTSIRSGDPHELDDPCEPMGPLASPLSPKVLLCLETMDLRSGSGMWPLPLRVNLGKISVLLGRKVVEMDAEWMPHSLSNCHRE